MMKGCNDSYYELSLKAGLLHLRIRLPAEVPSDQPAEAISPTTSATLAAFKWFQSARAGHLSVRETLHAFTGLESRLDDGQFHDLLLERSPDQIRVSIDENTVFFQQFSFDKIRPGFLEIHHVVLGSFPDKSADQKGFKGQIRQAILQVDDTTLNILRFAENSLHGFEIAGTPPTKCVTKSVPFSPVSLRQIYLLLRLPMPLTKSSPPPLFNKLPMQANHIHDWQQIEIDFDSHSENALLLLLFHRLGQLSAPLLGVELRGGIPWLVTQRQSLEISAEKSNLLRVGAGKITIPGRHEAAIIAAGYTTIKYFVAIDSNEFRPAFEAEVAGVLESASEGYGGTALFGRNLLLGGSNWTAEGEFGRGLDHLWSGLGRRRQFIGCINHLKLNGEVVDFEPIIRSRLRHRPLKRDQQLQAGCRPRGNCICQNGGTCVDGECNCLATAFSGEFCHIPAKILDFDKEHQLRLRFLLPHRLEATEVQFAFKTRTRNATLLSSYSQGSFSLKMKFFNVIQPDGMSVDLIKGCLGVMVMLDGREYVRLLEGEDQWLMENKTTIYVCLGGTDDTHQLEGLDVRNLIMRIQEIKVGQKTTPITSPFIGQIRHFTFNGVDPLLEPEYLVETPQLKMSPAVFLMDVQPAITLKTPDCFLRLPRLNLYGTFQLIFSLKTYQEDGVVLFNSGGGDFLAVELVRTQLTVSFDMGHGSTLQHQRIGRGFLSDGNWHQIIISRNGQMDEFLRIQIKSEFGDEEDYNLTIPSVVTARNFNFDEPLYLGGIPNEVRLRFSEKIISKHGIQGCIGGFGVNNQTQMDIGTLAEVTMGENRTSLVCKWQVVQGCLERPSEAPKCTAFAQQRRLPYCLNGGVCLHVWASLRCSCEMTTFTGNRCHLPGTSLKIGSSTRDGKESRAYVKYTYLHDHQNTNREEIALGLQVAQAFSPTRCTLLYVDTKQGNVDFLHIYLDSGLVNLVFNMGGGVVQLREQRRRLNDGNYHRIRIFRHGLAILLEVDELTTKHISNGPHGEQFNDQHTIWLGHAPATENYTDAFRGVLSGVFYNGLPLSDLAAGLSHRADVHVTRHSDIQYLANFKISLAPNSFFRQLPSADLANTEGTSYHDDEAALYAGEAHSSSSSLTTFTTTTTTIDSLNFQSHREWIQFPPQTRPSTDDSVSSPLQSHVNTWLLVCLGVAGLTLIVALLLLLAHCFQRRRRQRRYRPQPTRLTDQQITERVGEHRIHSVEWLKPSQSIKIEPVMPPNHPSISYVAFSEPSFVNFITALLKIFSVENCSVVSRTAFVLKITTEMQIFHKSKI
uniref:Neurexin 1 alpha n=1 Tax=Echinococcus granulosus TaxID=6210 RepID=A0A068WQX4_ECHGR|nr:neurexin 1 alpha [Echinococcus granulosus]